ncbi:MAG: HEAT repeat domain-containing protein, partial [Gemmatimonadetes bacterium]|nr:HEAT repeat domain-containing protein [Gemmatimonadota bacterium]
VKPLVDLAVYRGGTGIGGILLLVFTNGLGMGMRGVAVIAAGLIGLWVLATFRMKREFKDSVKRLIGIRDVSLRDLIAQRVDESTSEGLRRTLQGEDEDEIVYSLGLVRHHDMAAFAGELRELLHHESPDVRTVALMNLAEIEDRSSVPEARALLVDPDLDVRVAAMDYVCRFGTDDPDQELLDALDDEAYGVRAAAIAVILRHGGRVDATSESEPFHLQERVGDRGADALEALSGEEDLEARVYAARLMVEADLGSERGKRVMNLLLEDPDDSVRHAALQAATQTPGADFLPVLVDRLEVPRDRNAAVRALQRRAPEIRDLLFSKLCDPDAPLQQRLSIPKILRETADQAAVDSLVETLAARGTPGQVRFEILKTLGKLRRDRLDLDFEAYDVDPLVEREAREAYLWARRVHVVSEGKGTATFLERILQQRMEEAAERAFRSLGLHHELEDLEAAFAALRSRDELTRQRGFELVDNALPRRQRIVFDPLLNPDKSWKERSAAAEERFGAPPETREEILRTLMDEDGLCVSSLAQLALTGEPVEGVLTPRELREQMASRISLVLDEPYIEEAVRIMDILERADVLRKTDVFRELRGEELAGIASLMDEERLKEGEAAALDGDGSRLLVVVKGRVGAREDDRVVRSAGPGEVLVDPGFLDGRPSGTDSVALEESVVLSLPRLAFQRLLEERFTVVRGLLTHLGSVLRGERGEGPGGDAGSHRREKAGAAAD